MNAEGNWTVYRTRFLVRARQLTAPLVFTDPLGREHSGQPGDYLVESSDGLRRIIAPRNFFEDIYVPLEPWNYGTVAPVRRPVASAVASDLSGALPTHRASASAGSG